MVCSKLGCAQATKWLLSRKICNTMHTIETGYQSKALTFSRAKGLSAYSSSPYWLLKQEEIIKFHGIQPIKWPLSKLAVRSEYLSTLTKIEIATKSQKLRGLFFRRDDPLRFVECLEKIFHLEPKLHSLPGKDMLSNIDKKRLQMRYKNKNLCDYGYCPKQ